LGLYGVYASFSVNDTVSDEPTNSTVTVNGETTDNDGSLGEFVIGYTVNLLTSKNGLGWGLGLPLGVGQNNVKNQLVLEAGLQLRFFLFEIRGTYRTIEFRDNSFTISGGLCWF
jgi:hypothetical protein